MVGRSAIRRSRASVGIEGIAGQLQVFSSGGKETESSPHAKDTRLDNQSFNEKK